MATSEDIKKLFSIKSDEELIKIWKEETKGYSEEEIKLAAEELVKRDYDLKETDISKNEVLTQQASDETLAIDLHKKRESQEVTDEEVILFSGANAKYFYPKWKIFKQTGEKISFNVWAFLFGPLWMAFLKMNIYAYGLLFITIAVEILLEIEFGSTIAFEFIALSIVNFLTGIYGNYLYYKFTNRKILEIKVFNLEAGNEKLKIKAAGDSSLANAFLFLVVAIIVRAFVGLFLIAELLSDPVQQDVINYINKDIPSVATLESNAMSSYNAVTGDNYTSDLMLYNTLRSEVIPRYTRFVNQLSQIQPQTGELRNVHALYIEGANNQLNAFNLMLEALKYQDYNRITIANEKLANGGSLITAWKGSLQKLVREHNVVINK